MAIYQQEIILFRFGSGSGKGATHITRTDECNRHVPSPFLLFFCSISQLFTSGYRKILRCVIL
jgi:hypothetical protein